MRLFMLRERVSGGHNELVPVAEVERMIETIREHLAKATSSDTGMPPDPRKVHVEYFK